MNNIGRGENLYCICAEVAQSRSDANNSREEESEPLSKQEGGTAVKKNLYPPPASLFAPTQGCKTLPVMQHIQNTAATPSRHPQSTAAPPEECSEDLGELGEGGGGGSSGSGGGGGAGTSRG